MHIYFLRHAQATHNSDAARRGDCAYFDPANADAAIDDTGMAQLYVCKYPLPACNAIYCSPLRRCRQTLIGILPEAISRPVHLDDRLMEPQGQAVCNKRLDCAELSGSVPASWYLTGVGDVNPFDVVDEGYSSKVGVTTGFADRIRAFTDSLLDTHSDDQTILVVTHNDWITTWFELYSREAVAPRHCELIGVKVTPKKLIDRTCCVTPVK
jgi:broad specificity phosphatase PhoE